MFLARSFSARPIFLFSVDLLRSSPSLGAVSATQTQQLKNQPRSLRNKPMFVIIPPTLCIIFGSCSLRGLKKLKPIKNRSNLQIATVFKGRTEGVPPKTGFFERPHFQMAPLALLHPFAWEYIDKKW